MNGTILKINFFLEQDELIKNAYKLNGIPGSIIQGRYDLLCPVINALISYLKSHRSRKRNFCTFLSMICGLFNFFAFSTMIFNELLLFGAMPECGQILGAHKGSVPRCSRGRRIRAKCGRIRRSAHAHGEFAVATSAESGELAALIANLSAGAVICVGNASVAAKASGFASVPRCVGLLGFGFRVAVEVAAPPEIELS